MKRRNAMPSLVLAGLASLTAPATAQFGAVGLSGVGSQRFANEDLLFFEPQPGDHFGVALATGDFNGDGADDLATGIPDDNGITGFEIDNAGAVVVRFGIPASGLESGVADALLNQISGGSPDPAEVGDRFGAALAACDFNDDGFDDLAVAVPGESVNGASAAGAIEVFFGSASGLVSAPVLLSQQTSGVPGDPETPDGFGSSLACGDFDGDTFADLAVGVPGEATDSFGRAGMVEIVYGSATGLDAASSIALDQDTSGMAGSAEMCDYFGHALAVGDFDSDGFADLAIGVPGEDNPSSCAASVGRGAVQIVFGDTLGLMPNVNVLYTESDLGGAPENGDEMGAALAAGDFDGDLFDDLAIGVPREDVNSGGSVVDAGTVFAIYGRAGSPPFDPARTQIWFEDLIHYPGASETGDLFGFALAAGDFDRDGRADLAIGQPGELQVVAQDGGVTVVMGSPTGITAARRHGFAAGYYGEAGVANQANRNYGFALAAGDFDGDGFADLGIGAPNEDEAGRANVGAVVALYGSLFSDGFEVQNAGFWSSVTP